MAIKSHSVSQNRRLSAQGSDFKPFVPDANKMGWGKRKGESVRIDSALLNKIRVIAKTQGWTIRTTLDRAAEKFIGLQPKPKSKSKG